MPAGRLRLVARARGRGRPRYRRKRKVGWRYRTNMIGPVPVRKKLRLKYVQRITINPGASGGAVLNNFRANSLFDPDRTGTGHQPIGFDEWAVFYNRYTVVSSKIKIIAFGSAATGPLGNIIVGINLDDDNTSSAILTQLLEQSSVRYKPMGPALGGHGVTTVRHSFNAKKFFGTKGSLTATSDYAALMDASPLEDATYNVFVASVDASDNGDPVDFLVEIVYTCYLSEPTTLAQS